MGSSSIPHPLPYIISPSIWSTSARSPTVEIFLTAFSTQAFRTCHRQRKILAAGQTMLHTEVKVNMINFYIWNIKMKDMRIKLVIPQCVEFCLGIVNYDGWGRPFFVACGYFFVQGLKDRCEVLLATSWYGEESNRDAIPPVVKNHNRV